MTKFWRAVAAVSLKECLHTLRDKLTLALLITVPLVQLVLFGFAIDLHPRALPTVLIAQENDKFTQRAASTLEKLGYFKVIARTNSREDARRMLAQSHAQFMLELPAQFGSQILLNDKPEVRLTADATDPIASIVAVQAAQASYQSLGNNLPITLKTELAYNPSGASKLFVIPGLLGVIVTLTMVLLGALAMVRERERGTLETLASLAMPRGSLLLGKAIPYFLMGCALYLVLLFLCTHLLGLPWPRWSIALYGIAFLFIAANLMLGLAFSLMANNAMQAMQLSIFFYLPSMLLSGFMFSFYGMPAWARGIGETLPLTHFLRVVRGILLKNLSDADAWPLAWPIVCFALLATLAATLLYRWRSVTND
jgi:ABC-2 type transport system permease protein